VTSVADVDDAISRTYVGLRLGMVVLAVLLFAGVAVQAVAFGCLQGSLSAYYYTPARSVFVAALCAIGACLVVYRGNTTAENALLNVAGFLVALVAFVPTGFGVDPRGCPSIDPVDADAAVLDGVLALVVAGVVSLLVGAGQSRLTGLRPARSSRWSFAAIALLLAVVLATFVGDREWFLRWAHGIAAGLFFAVVLAVIHLNATATAGRTRVAYRLFFAGPLVVGAALTVARLLDPGFRTYLLWLETVGIVGFGGFWVVQTVELGGAVRRVQESGDTGPPAVPNV
jgi:hypothetical protein